MVPEPPVPPVLEFDEAGNLTPDSMVDEGLFRRRYRDYRDAVERCELVTHDGA